jgi:hypothetical protein
MGILSIRIGPACALIVSATLIPSAPAEDQPLTLTISDVERDRVLAEATSDEPRLTKNLLGLDAAPLDGPLVSDRPDFTESAVTIPWGHVQLEGGYTFTYDREGGERTRDHTFPEFLFRIGLVEDVELRVGWLGWSMTDNLFKERNDAGRLVTREDREEGATDMDVGFKFHVLDQDGFVPDFAIMPMLSVPTGTTSKTSTDVDPLVALLWAYDLTERWALAGQFIFAAPTSEKGRFFQAASSLSLGLSITDRLGAYTEYFGFYHNDRDTDSAHTLNGGFTFLVTDNLQFDIRAGFGLNEEADDFFTGAGFVILF